MILYRNKHKLKRLQNKVRGRLVEAPISSWLNSKLSRVKLKTYYSFGPGEAPQNLNIIIKYASRTRPELFKSSLNNWIDKLSLKHNILFVCSFDDDDETMKADAISTFIDEKRRQVKIDVYFNPPPQNKISAMNANLESYQADMVFLCQDDMGPLIKNYDDLIARYLFRYFPNGDGVINIRLLLNIRRWQTIVALPALGWKYYKKFNYIYNPAYISVYPDNELKLVAEKLGKLAHINDGYIMAHNWHEINDDLNTYNLSKEVYDADYAVFKERQAKNFDL